MAGESEWHKAVQWVKRHPYLTAGTVFAGGAVLIFLYYDSSAAPAAQPTVAATGSNLADLEGAQLQADAIGAQQQASLQALSDQLSAQNASIAGAESIASIQGSTDIQLASLNAQTLEDSINAAAGVATITGAQNLQLGLSSLASQVSIAGITANQNLQLASIAASTTDFQTAASTQEFDVAQYDASELNLTNTNLLYNYLNNQGSYQYNEQQNLTGTLGSLLNTSIAESHG